LNDFHILNSKKEFIRTGEGRLDNSNSFTAQVGYTAGDLENLLTDFIFKLSVNFTDGNEDIHD
jgi:hypothetical protein